MEKKKYRKKHCKYCESKINFIDYKNVKLLKHSLSERYKIMPRRLTGNCKYHQDILTIAIKRARQVALIPYVVDRKVVGIINPTILTPISK